MTSDLFKEFDSVAFDLSLPQGSVLFRRGDPASAVYVLRTGKVAFVWSDSHGIHPMDTHTAGSIIGLPAALNGEYSITARAVEDSELGFIPVPKVMELLECNPRLMQAATKLLGQEVARMRSLLTSPPANRSGTRRDMNEGGGRIDGHIRPSEG